MCLPNELVDSRLVADNVGLEVVKIKDFGSLGLGQDEVQEKDQAEPGVERDPSNDEKGPGLKEQCQGKNGEVDQPWVNLGRVVGTESFV